MKLIDLLVQELPKSGGWKENWVVVTQDADGYFCCWSYDDPKYNGFGWRHRTGKGLVGYWRVDNDVVLSCDSTESIVTRNQYESALAASQKPAWNGEGLPSVGMHCEIVDPDGVLMYGQGESGEVISHVENTAVIRMSYGLGCFEARFLRPLRSEADKKRDAAVEAIDYWLPECIPDTPNEFYHAKKIYDAIAAGKIPGVKLDD